MTRLSTIASASVTTAALVVGIAHVGVAAPTSSPPPSTPTTTGDFVLPAGWTTLIDDTNTISVAVPDTWTDVDLAPESNPDGTLVPSIEAAATDIGVFTATFDEPGIFYRAFAYSADNQSLMDRHGLTRGCHDRDILPYDDGAFTGLHAAWTECGPTLDPEWHQIVASPASQSFTIVLQIQITSEDEQALLDNVLASFNFTPQGGSTPGPFPPPTAPGETTTTTTTTTAPTPTTTTAPTPTTLFPEPSGTVAPGAQQLVDDSGVLSVHVPAGWTETSTTPYTGQSLTDAPYIAASTDLQLFLPGQGATDTYSVPGAYYLAIPYTADIDAAMNQWGTIGGCAFADPEPYSDGVFTGLIRVATSCGGTATRIVTIVANPSDSSYTIVLLLQLTGQDDAIAYDTVLSSFTMIGPASSDPASSGDATTTSTG